MTLLVGGVGGGGGSNRINGGSFIDIQAAPHLALPNIDTTNGRSAFKAGLLSACAAAALALTGILATSGTYWITADNGVNSGVDVIALDNAKLTIKGEGPLHTIWKRTATETVQALSNAAVWYHGNEGAEYSTVGICFDGNEQNHTVNAATVKTYTATAGQTVFGADAGPSPQPFRVVDGRDVPIPRILWAITGTGVDRICTFHTGRTAGEVIRIIDIFAYEQTSNVRTKVGTGTIEKLVYTDCHFNNPVGDGFVSATLINYLTFNHCEGWSEGRRTRASLQFSRPAIVTTINGGIFHSIEMEPGATPANAVQHMSDVSILGPLDLAGDVNDGWRITVNLTNIEHKAGAETSPLDYSNVFAIIGRAVNSTLSKPVRFQRSDFQAINATIRLGVRDLQNGDLTEIGSMQVWHDQGSGGTDLPFLDGGRQRFVLQNTKIIVHPGTSVGFLVSNEVPQQTLTALTAIINCWHEGPQPQYIYQAVRCGRAIVRGGTLTPYAAVMTFANDLNPAKLVVGDMENWSGAIFFMPSEISVTATIYVNGPFDGETLTPFTAGTTTRAEPLLKWGGDAVMMVDSSPVGRLRGWPGLRCRLKSPVHGADSEWVYRPSVAGTIGALDQWRLVA